MGAFWGGVSAYANGQNVLIGALIGGVVGGVSSLYSGLFFGALSKVVATIVTIPITFSIGVMGDIAGQRFLENKSINKVDQREAAIAGGINVATSILSTYRSIKIVGDKIKIGFDDSVRVVAEEHMITLLNALLNYLF